MSTESDSAVHCESCGASVPKSNISLHKIRCPVIKEKQQNVNNTMEYRDPRRLDYEELSDYSDYESDKSSDSGTTTHGDLLSEHLKFIKESDSQLAESIAKDEQEETDHFLSFKIAEEDMLLNDELAALKICEEESEAQYATDLLVAAALYGVDTGQEVKLKSEFLRNDAVIHTSKVDTEKTPRYTNNFVSIEDEMMAKAIEESLN